ncbi:hypothetical protein ACMYR3_11095 [Ampullimonas aquatilis]|uniref:hypothetical protein n=1 Tax=Ampullimonas aquatilis TaxID=1341549 RepID=UPI003C70ECF7
MYYFFGLQQHAQPLLTTIQRQIVICLKQNWSLMGIYHLMRLKAIDTPSNLVDVLKNINSSITQHLLMNSSFLEDENLKKMFGAGNIERMPENNLEKTSVSFIAVDKLKGMNINIWQAQSKPFSTNIIINIYSKDVESPTFEEIEKIYGIN